MKSISTWRIGQRILLIKLITIITVLLVLSETYLFGLASIKRELQIQGQQLVGLLADSAEYGVVSGNTELLDHQLTQVLARNKNISSIEILDRNGRRLIEKSNPGVPNVDTLRFSEAILIKSVSFNTYDLEPERITSTSAIPKPPLAQADERDGKPIGFVNVRMPRSALTAEPRTALYGSTLLAAVLLCFAATVAARTSKSLVDPLLATIHAVRTMRKDKTFDLSTPYAGGEIGELQATLAEMAEGFFRSQQSLEEKVQERTAALAAANSELERMHADTLKLSAERRMLLRQVTNAAEAERRMIAVEIHDQLNASLIVARLETQHILETVNTVRQSYRAGALVPDAEIHLDSTGAAAAKVLELVGDLYKIARGIVKRLRPEVIDTLGLVLALEEMVGYYDKSHPDCYFDLNTKGDLEDLSDDLALSVYRIVQESLSNIIKYAGASVVQVALGVDEEKQRVLLRVTDNGKGFDVDSVQLGLGLIGMRERVSGGEGELTITSAPGKGSTISAYIPLVRKTSAGS
jgi:two-component system sensor histidine kinase UhpB